jgi:hypothetical protein
MVYFAPEAAEEYSALGYDLAANRAAAYFPARAAALGAVGPGVVQAVFYSFAPRAVAAGMDRAWEIATPEQLVQARLRVADRALRRLCGELLHEPGVAEAVELAREACAGCTAEGRPLSAGAATLDWPEPTHLQLFHAVGLLREFRGDGHVAALVVEGIGGLEAGVLHVAQGDAWTREPLRKTRGWTTEQWDAAVAGLQDRGWLDAEAQLTDEGRAVRQRLEDRTDVLALAPWERLGEERCSRLRALVRPLSKAIVAAGGVGIR